jgi:nicotinate-nucleotide pyrophosphorylase
MQKESGVLATKKLLDYVLSLGGTALNVHRLENGDGVLKQELCIASSASADRIVVMWRVTVYIEKFEDPQLAA